MFYDGKQSLKFYSQLGYRQQSIQIIVIWEIVRLIKTEAGARLIFYLDYSVSTHSKNPRRG